MPQVSWNARNELGELLEVHADTEAIVASPGPAELTQGDPVLHRWTVEFDTPNLYKPASGFDYGVVLRSLPAESFVLQGWIALALAWDNLAANRLIELDLYYDGAAAGEVIASRDCTENDDGGRYPTGGWPFSTLQAVTTLGQVGPPERHYLTGKFIYEAMDLIVKIPENPGTPPTQGSADIYALIAEPA